MTVKTINTRSWFWILAVGAASFSLLPLIYLFPDALYRLFPVSQYLVFHSLVELVSVVVSLQIFLLSWVTYQQTQNYRSLFIGAFFLGVALLDVFHIFSFPGMPGLFTSASTHKGIYFWLAARLWAAGALLAAGLLPLQHSRRRLSPRSLLGAVLAAAALIVALDVFFGEQLPRFFIAGQGLTPLKIVLEYVVMALGLAAFLAYSRLYAQEQDRSLPYLKAGLMLMVISEMCFTFYASAFDSYNLLGHIYKFVSYGFFFYALFIAGVRQPYRQLAQSHRVIEEASRHWQETFTAISDGIWLLDPEGRVIQSNGVFEKLLGIETKEVLEHHCYQSAHQTCDFIADCPFQRMRQKGAFLKEELELKQSGIWLQISVYPIVSNGEGLKGAVHIVRDITARKQAEEALRRSEQERRLLSAQLIKAEENERKRIAQELHDGLGQSLSAIKFLVEGSLVAAPADALPPGKEQLLPKVIPLIKEAVEEVRRVCMDLRPSILDDLGIIATLSWFGKKFRTVYPHIAVNREIEIEEEEIPPEVKTVIYRVVQEACNNIAKHSLADKIELTLKKNDRLIELTIEDNGKGFDPQAALTVDNARRGMGLGGMRERVELSGGTFAIESQPGQGARVRASWPAAVEAAV